MITLDVKNAFNSAARLLILKKLKKRKIKVSLVRVIASNLIDNGMQLEAEGRVKTINLTRSGVPQGLLWVCSGYVYGYNTDWF